MLSQTMQLVLRLIAMILVLRNIRDLAKGFDIPIVHVNADDPEACLVAANLAIQYRMLFKKISNRFNWLPPLRS